MIARLALVASLAVLPSLAVAQTSCGVLSNCPNASTPLSGNELLYIIQGGVSKKTTVSAIGSGGGGSGTVGSGSSGQIAAYPATGTLVQGTPTASGVLTAFGIAPGSGGSLVINGGALGTPSSGAMTNLTGTPASLGLANATGQPASIGLANGTGLPLSTGVTGTLPVANGGTGDATFTANKPLIGNGTGAVGQGTTSGSTTVFGTVSGALTNGDCVSINTGNLVDAGGPCTTGGGGGTVSSGTIGQLAGYSATGTTVSGQTTGTGVLTALSTPVGSSGAFVTNGGALGTPSSGTLTNASGLPLAGVSGFGTGVAGALGNSIGSAGSVVLNGGALGTPTSGTLTNTTGLPLAGVTGFGTGVSTALGINLGTAGSVVVNGGALGTPANGVLTNTTGLPLTTGVTGVLPYANGGTGLSTLGSAGQCLTTNSGVTAVVWGTCSSSSQSSIPNASGSTENTTGNISATSNSLGLTAAMDFTNGQGIRVNHAGTAFSLGSPTGATITVTGTAGTTTYQYEISSFDGAGGVGAHIASFNTTTGNATLGTVNYNKLSWTAPGGTAPTGYAIYKNISGTYTLIGVASGVTTFSDYGYTAFPYLDWLPSTAPSASLADNLTTTISTGGGTTTLTLAASASTAASSTGVYHDDSAAIQAAANAGPVLVFPSGTFYADTNVSLPSGEYVTGNYSSTILRSVYPGQSVLTLTNSGGRERVSNIAIQLVPNSTGVNVGNSYISWVDHIQCFGADNGDTTMSNCIYAINVTNLNIDTLFASDWAASLGGGFAGGATPAIDIAATGSPSVPNNQSVSMINLNMINDGLEPLPSPMITADAVAPLQITHAILYGELYGGAVLGEYGLSILGNSQAVSITDFQVLDFSSDLYSNSDATGSPNSISVINSHFDFCYQYCMNIEAGAWLTFIGNTFAGENNSPWNFVGNGGIAVASGVNGPSVIEGNTFESFTSTGAFGIGFAGSPTGTSVYGNQFAGVTTYINGTPGTQTVFGATCTSGISGSTGTSFQGILGHC